MSDSEEMEKPAKRWEVAAVANAQEAQGQTLKAIELKVDKILDVQVTHSYVDEKVRVLKEKVDTDIKSIYLKYDPIVDNIKWLTRVLIVAVLGLVANIAIQLWSK